MGCSLSELTVEMTHDGVPLNVVPNIHVLENFLKPETTQSITKFSQEECGHDKTMDNGISRRKSIAFIFHIKDNVYALDQDYFIQSENYNTSSGGFKRYYKQIPQSWIQEHMREPYFKFAEINRIPEFSLTLL